MKGKDDSLLRLMKGDFIFSIPIYQRKYSWQEQQCRALLDSIVRIANDAHREWHFLGSIIYLSKEEEVQVGVNEFQIIDGQQRLTSMSLLLLAIMDMDDVSEEIKTEIKHCLFNLEDYSSTDTEYIKLQLREEDNIVFKRLLDDRQLPNNVTYSRVYENYIFFKRILRNEELTADIVFKGIKKLKIISFSLKRSDNAQFVFETVNSTGLQLSAADKIRNFIFMNENDEEKQQRLYTNYWHPMEVNLGLTTGNEVIFNDFFLVLFDYSNSSFD